MVANETIRWYVMALGDQKDIHGVHFHGATLLQRGSRTDSIDLMPGSTSAADMVPDVAGRWMVHCHTGQHVRRGMTATYFVEGCDPPPCPVKRP